MNLFVVGATGKTGREVLDVALARNHHVTAFVRSPEKIARRDSALRILRGDPLDVKELTAALEGHDGVLSALGLPPSKALRPSTFMAESAATTVAAMRTVGVARLCIVSAAVLFPGSGLQFAFFKWFLKHHARDLSAMETVVAASDLEWTIARPPRLVQAKDPEKGEGYIGLRDALPEGANTATFRGVAAFMVDALERRSHLREVVGLIRSASS